jgi:hypothetical protein
MATNQFSERITPIRNERVISSNLISGSPLFQEDYLLKPKDFGGFSARSVGARRSALGHFGADSVATVATAVCLGELGDRHGPVQSNGASMTVTAVT